MDGISARKRKVTEIQKEIVFWYSPLILPTGKQKRRKKQMKKFKQAAAIVTAAAAGTAMGTGTAVAPAFATETVANAPKTIEVPETQYEVLFDEGSTLADISLPENWKFRDETQKIEAGKNTYTVEFTGDKTAEYEQSTDDMEVSVSATEVKDPEKTAEVKVPENTKVSDAGIEPAEGWTLAEPDATLREGENRVAVKLKDESKYIGKNATRYMTVKATIGKIQLELPRELPEMERTLKEGQKLSDISDLGSVKSPITINGETKTFKVVISSNADMNAAMTPGTYTYEISLDIPEDLKDSFEAPTGKLRVVVEAKNTASEESGSTGGSSGGSSGNTGNTGSSGNTGGSGTSSGGTASETSEEEPSSSGTSSEGTGNTGSTETVKPSASKTSQSESASQETYDDTEETTESENHDAEETEEDTSDVSDVSAKPLSDLISSPQASENSASKNVADISSSSIVKASDIADANEKAAKKAENDGDDLVVGNRSEKKEEKKSTGTKKKTADTKKSSKTPIAAVVGAFAAAVAAVLGFLGWKKKNSEEEETDEENVE